MSRSPSSVGSPQLLPGEGHAGVAIPAGTYAVVMNGSQRPGQLRPVIRVPAGYTGNGFAVNTGLRDNGTVEPNARGLSFWGVHGVYTNPCTAGKYPTDPGPSVADLAQALASQPLRAGTDPAPVNVAGYAGLFIKTSVPARIDLTMCKDGYFDSWTSTNGGGRFEQGPGEKDRLWILNIHGTGGRATGLPYRLVIDGWHMPEATPREINQITRMVKTLTFQAPS